MGICFSPRDWEFRKCQAAAPASFIVKRVSRAMFFFLVNVANCHFYFQKVLVSL